MAATDNVLSNDVVANFVFYATLVVLKTVLMSPLTSMFRIGKKVFSNPEDCKAFGGGVKDHQVKPILTDPMVERVRRCHLNDLENVVPFVILGAFYCLTNPILGSALLVFRFFAVARVLHTVCYLGCIPQPSRATMFGIGLTVNLYMAFKIIEKVSSIALESF